MHVPRGQVERCCGARLKRGRTSWAATQCKNMWYLSLCSMQIHISCLPLPQIMHRGKRTLAHLLALLSHIFGLLSNALGVARLKGLLYASRVRVLVTALARRQGHPRILLILARRGAGLGRILLDCIITVADQASGQTYTHAALW